MSASDEARAWAETVQAVAKDRDLVYEPVGGINPVGGPVALCPGGTNRLTGQLADGFWGASCDADEHEEGGLFSKAVLPGAVLRQVARARPGQGDAAVQRRVDRAPPRRARRCSAPRAGRSSSRAWSSTSASWRPCPASTTRSRSARCSARRSSTGSTTIDNEIDFGVSEQQLWFLWRLARPHPRSARGGARQRRRAVQAGAQRGRGVRRPHLPRGSVARRPRAVPGRLGRHRRWRAPAAGQYPGSPGRTTRRSSPSPTTRGTTGTISRLRAASSTS